jgi:hypothetical protein
VNSGNIKTSKDAKNLGVKSGALETQDVYKKRRQKSDRQDATRRPHYNPPGGRTGRTKCESMRVQNVRYSVGSNYDR